jgi:hypothetical protein
MELTVKDTVLYVAKPQDRISSVRNNIWLVGYQDGKWWCCDRSPSGNDARQYKIILESVHNAATLLMMKHHPKRDMSQARIVSDTRTGFGMPRLETPLYIDYSGKPRKTPEQVWVIEGAPTRYWAIKLARYDWDSKLLMEEDKC